MKPGEMPEDWIQVRESVRRQIVQQFTQAGKSPGLIASMDLFSTRLFDSIAMRIAEPLRRENEKLREIVKQCLHARQCNAPYGQTEKYPSVEQFRAALSPPVEP